jgi:hypothetical protein
MAVRTPIPLPLMTARSRSTHASDVRLVNCYAEEVGDIQDRRFVVHGSAGLAVWSDASSEACRGLFTAGDELLAVHGNRLLAYDASGAATFRGLVPGMRPVRFARNGAAVPQTVIISDAAMWTYAAGVLTAYAPAAFGGVLPVDVAWVDGYFVFAMADGRFFISGINTIAVNALDFAVAESSPDGLVAVKVLRREVYLFGTETTEVWTNIGDPLFAFSRLPGATMEIGCSSRDSVAESGGVLYWLDDAGNVVRLAGGYAPEVITPRGLSESIEAVADKRQVIGFAFDVKQRSSYVVASAAFTWELEAATGWTERQSLGQPCWRANAAAFFSGKTIVGSRLDGKLYWLTETANFEGDPKAPGTEMVMRARFPRIAPFPMGGIVSQVDIDIETGVGSDTDAALPDTADPQVTLCWSKDGGKTWPGNRIMPLGAKGDYGRRVRAMRIGGFREKGVIFEVSISSRVARTLLGLSVIVEPLDI